MRRGEGLSIPYNANHANSLDAGKCLLRPRTMTLLHGMPTKVFAIQPRGASLSIERPLPDAMPMSGFWRDSDPLGYT
jgi:hypothetical protein